MGDILFSLLHLPPSGAAGLTRQLTDQLRSLIATGRLGAGEALPSSRHLAKALGIARNTVTQTIEQLAAEGYLEVASKRRPRVARNASPPISPRQMPAPQSASRLRPSLWARGLGSEPWPPISRASRPRAFEAGMGDEREFPHPVWGRCLRLAAGRVPRRSGLGGNDESLREALLAYLATRRGIRARPDQIILLPSAQAGLTLIAKTMLDPGDAAWIESPGYGGAYAALRSVQAQITGVSLDASGLTLVTDRPAPRLIFTTPSHQYPTGRLMPIA